MGQTNIQQLKNVTEEILGEDELINLLDSGVSLNHYIGFEISGLVHLGTGLMSGIVIRELQELGVNTSVWLADWHTWINNKLGGDREFILAVGKDYFAQALLISAKIAGADPDKVTVRYGSEQYHNNDVFWQSLVDISKNLTLSRVVKSTTIMGRQDTSSMEFAQLIYPPMQVADIFELKVQLAHAGTDQRKAHVIAREVAKKLSVNPLIDNDGNRMKPVGVHHHLLLGLQKPSTWPLPEGFEKDIIRTQMKMSKSIQGSAIFIHDSEDEIRNKIRKAFCPDKEIDFNPVLDWVKHIIFPIRGELQINREERHGGNYTGTSFEEIEERFSKGELFSLDLKEAVASSLIEMLAPAREFFAAPEKKQLIEEIKRRRAR